jgi:hypothetical protein
MRAPNVSPWIASAFAAFALPAVAAEVELRLDRVTVETCRCDLPGGVCYSGQFVCSGEAIAATLTPRVPQGAGQLDLDASGRLLGGSLNLEAFSRVGVVRFVGWTRAVSPRDPSSSDGFLALDQGWGDARLEVTSFTDPAFFAGRLVDRYRQEDSEGWVEDQVVESYSFTTSPGPGFPEPLPPPPPSGLPPRANVSFQLDAVTIEHCLRECTEDEELGSNCHPTSCDPPVDSQLEPSTPRGGGWIQLDSAGRWIDGELSLDGFSATDRGEWLFSLDPFARSVEPLDPEASPGVVAEGEWGDATLELTSFTSPSEFTGRILARGSLTHSRDGVVHYDPLVYAYSFAAPPFAAPPPCGRLHVDADGDGEEDSRDLALLAETDGRWGTAVDGAGRTIADFCRGVGAIACARGDFANDEPLRKRPRDCTQVEQECRPAELMPPTDPPPLAGPTCQGEPLFVDSDLDGEVDATDRCPATPSGAAIDEVGCSRAEFCGMQTLAACARADFRNDEPLRGKPRDCERRRGQCVAGTVP